MKKTYINPNIEVVNIHTTGMLAVSAGDRITEESINPQDKNAITDGMGRYFDFDDEEEY